MAQLNGAFYGPSIPPPSGHYRRPSGDGCGCCCGGLFRWCCGCIFNCILSLICKILTTILIIVAIVGFLFWLIVRPNVVKFHVTNATLTQFNFTTTPNSNNTLHYNLALNVSVRNPNQRVGIYYDYIEARALYQDVRFGSLNLGPFYQHHKNTSFLNPVFKGQQVMVFGSEQNSELNKEKESGVYNVDLMMFMKVRFKWVFFKTGTYKPKVSCKLEVPLKSHNGNSPSKVFQETRCDYAYGWLRIH